MKEMVMATMIFTLNLRQKLARKQRKMCLRDFETLCIQSFDESVIVLNALDTSISASLRIDFWSTIKVRALC